ncbi:MAG: flavin reductase family protein [Deltaproteobacteria bacterium]|nr:flavin reductase family protein [Deltaproteobacteria bacterium]
MKKQLGPQSMIFPMPALLVGTHNEDGTANAMTAAWAAVCCYKPVCVGVAVRDNRHTFVNINRTKAFTLNVPNTSQTAEVDYLGIVSGLKEPNKVAIAGIETAKGVVDAPILVSCPVNLECGLLEQVKIGTHTWFIGEVLEAHVDEGLVTENGTVDVDALDPLIYATSAGEYRSIGKPVGKAYSVGKKIKKG